MNYHEPREPILHMTPLLKKLNLAQQSKILVLNAPQSFDVELAALVDVSIQRKSTAKEKVSFGIAFAISQVELDQLSQTLVRSVSEDSILWIAYPKGTSKNYTCEFNRDKGWSVLGDAGYEPVRQISIDSDWTALRFRKATEIKKLTRRSSMAISSEGKRRTQGLRSKKK